MGADDFWLSLGFAIILLAASAGMLWSHVHTWRRFQSLSLEPREHDFRRRQFRRRMQSSAMLGLLAVAILLGQWITSPPFPRVAPLIFWGVVLLLVLWMGLLAAADLIATRFYYRRLRDGYLVEQARLQAELRRVQKTLSNGKSRHEEEEN